MPVEVHRFDSEILRGNPLGDPTERDVCVYRPPGYDAERSYPVLLAIVGYTGTGAMLFNKDPLGEDLASKLDRLIESGACPPVIVAAPDCFTRVGGNQYINSKGTGRYEDYLLEEVMPLVEDRYRTGAWGVFGKSSGGYGSITLGMRHPERFQAVGMHSGDACFELCYMPDFAGALDAFREAGGPAKWLDAYWADGNRRRRKYFEPLNILGMAAHYSPNPDSPDAGIDFPFDLDTGELRPQVWERWRAWDPVNNVEKYADNLRKLRVVYIDCGTEDENGLIWGARALAAKLRSIGVEPHFEEFVDTHVNLGYRYDSSIPLLTRALL